MIKRKNSEEIIFFQAQTYDSTDKYQMVIEKFLFIYLVTLIMYLNYLIII